MPEERIGDDEQRRAAPWIGPARRVAAAGLHLLRRSSLTYRQWVRRRRRFSHLGALALATRPCRYFVRCSKYERGRVALLKGYKVKL
jgi:hypothetical protein